MNPNICNNCGGDFEYRNGRWVCRACGSYKPEELSNEEVTLLYTAYQKLRLADFDQAEQEFDDIIQKYPRNPHGYWGRLMSKYGIKYEEDFDGRMIPTCYATSIESILSATDYQKALQFADAENKAYFTKQAEYIERVRKEWVEKARKEKPYDIFISYKDSDLANGIERTKDSYAVQELYIHLTRKGYRVFFSRESLRDKAGEKYEPYIFSALSSAKVMLVYGSKPEYITSTWLKNEWMRYEKRIRLGEKHPNSLLVARDGFSPYELPKALSTRQGFDATQRSFYSDLEEAIEHILHDKTKIAAAPKATKPKKNRKALVLFVSTILIAATTGVAGFLMLANKEPPAGPPITTDGTSNTTIEPTTDEPLTDELTSNTEAELVSKREPENETDPVETEPVETEPVETEPVEAEAPKAAYPELDNLIAYLPLDKKIGNKIDSDIVTERGKSPAFDLGYKSAAFSTGKDGYITLGENWKPGTNSFSVGMWVKGVSTSGWVCLLANMDWNLEDTGFVFVWYQDNIRGVFNFNGVKKTYIFNVPDDYLNRWMYITMVVDRENGQVKMSFDFDDFIVFDLDPTICADGVKFDSYNDMENLADYRAVAIGNDGDGCLGVPIGNMIDEVLVFNDALTMDDVALIAEYYGVAD